LGSRRQYCDNAVSEAHASVCPLFLRFAIEQPLVGELGSTRTLDLVLQYVEALRPARVPPIASRAYTRAAQEFFDWLTAKGVMQLAAIERCLTFKI
jgi:hypothetical protein